MEPLASLPLLEWSRFHASGQAAGLGWVDSELDDSRPPFRVVQGRDGAFYFHHVPYARLLPPLMADEARRLQGHTERAASLEAGTLTARMGDEPTDVPAVEALILLFARVEWLLATRPWFFTAFTPVPALLACLIEVYGIEAQIHRNRHDTLLRLVAILSSWHPIRGTLASARRVLDAAESTDAKCPALVHAPGEPPEALKGEILLCRQASFYELRGVSGRSPLYRIERGLLFFQGAEPSFGLRKEDVLLTISPDQPLPADLPRLLPPWTQLRLTVGEMPEPIDQEQT